MCLELCKNHNTFERKAPAQGFLLCMEEMTLKTNCGAGAVQKIKCRCKYYEVILALEPKIFSVLTNGPGSIHNICGMF